MFQLEMEFNLDPNYAYNIIKYLGTDEGSEEQALCQPIDPEEQILTKAVELVV